MDPTIRRARHEDADAVERIADAVWADRDIDDYVPAVFDDWVDGDGPEQRTVVAEVDGRVAGLCQAVLLTEAEAWFQGIRVDPAHRGDGIGSLLTEHLVDWAAAAGAAVGRNLVFSWNDAGLGQSLAAGFEAVTSFRWAFPEPRDTTPDLPVGSDPDAAWRYWEDCEGRQALTGLALDSDLGWALSALTRDRLDRLAAEERVLTVGDEPRGMACRVRTTTRIADGDALAEYAVGVWDDADAARALFAAIAADAAALGVDATRVLIPETPRHVSEAAYARGSIDDCPDFVCEIELD